MSKKISLWAITGLLLVLAISRTALGGDDQDWKRIIQPVFGEILSTAKSHDKVGIGTANPQSRLHVMGGLTLTKGGPGETLQLFDTERPWAFKQFDTAEKTALELKSIGGGGNKNFLINTTGMVGIGTTDPKGTLHITNEGDGKTLLVLDTERAWAFRQLGTGPGTALELASLASEGGDAGGGIANKNFIINTLDEGKVGIGITNPRSKLHVKGSTNNPALIESTHSGNTAWLFLKNPGVSGDFNTVGIASQNDHLHLRAGDKTRVFVKGNGDVGIGTTNPQAPLHIRADQDINLDEGGSLIIGDTNGGNLRLDSNEIKTSERELLTLNPDRDGGDVAVGHHLIIGNLDSGGNVPALCRKGNGPFEVVKCGSTAQNVPTVDQGQGDPEPGDLITILVKERNSYGDDHRPFVVARSTKPCDDNLFGFITPGNSGNGKKLNKHYMPVAVDGFFPAKVTMENGPIKRGDAITSSSKPGYGMKATDACKVIGYALEDIKQDGQVQVFAHLTEYAAPQVKTLRAQVRELQIANQDLRKQVSAMQTQMLALTRVLDGQDRARLIAKD